jgi:ABC-type transport system involved in Fe-S cluster assembly fused permease/ATPase subunit
LTACYAVISLLYFAESALLVDRDHDAITTQQDRLVHLVVCGLTWLLTSATHHAYAAWAPPAIASVDFALEVPLVVLLPRSPAVLDVLLTAALTVRVFVLAGIVFVAAIYYVRDIAARFISPKALPEESQPILGAAATESTANGYGAVPASPSGSSTDCDSDADADASDDEDSPRDDEAAKLKKRRAKRIKEAGGWIAYLREFRVFLPYLIPRNDVKVQLCYLVCLLCLAAGRALNFLIPNQLGKATDQLLSGQAPYGTLLIWLLLSLLRDEAGIDLIESLAKIPIEQFSYRQVTTGAFNHVMSLPMEFHAERDSAELMRAVEQGHSLTRLLRSLVLDIMPTVVDQVLALAILYKRFNIFASIVLLTAGVCFFILQAVSTSWNLDHRRAMTKASREEARVMHQAVQGWQTVTYFNMFRFESKRFGAAVEDQLTANRRWQVRSSFIEAFVETIRPLTFFTLACLVAYEITAGNATPGDFVFLLQYWSYLVWPMVYLSHSCRYMMSDLVDAERLLALLQTKPSIADRDGAVSLPHVEGRVAFESVGFSYDPRKPTVRDLNITAAPGQTIALVGETGAGKSTIMKLLLRFYDVTSGRITIDGHDIRDITLDSLRNALGVVPQDPLLFNASVIENLRYARPEASEEEIHEACRAAAIHEKILTFVDGYNTVVGEQGVKLSGGEIQRLAIARVFLKDPPILILDEATSAVDTHTESSIQRALEVLKKGRTTFVIAHRLSTIIRADRILVIHDGQVVESGPHDELMKLEGRYHGLWTAQTGGARGEEEKAAEEAEVGTATEPESLI